MIKPKFLVLLGFALVMLGVVEQARVYGWAESFFYYGFPFSEATPFRAHYVTLLISLLTAFYTVIHHYELGIGKALFLGGLVPLVGLSGFEVMWHYGWLLPEEMKPLFWGIYFALSTFMLLYLQGSWAGVFEWRTLAFFALVYVGLFAVWLLYADVTGFYPALILHEAGKAPNPHSVPFFIFKGIVLILPLILLGDKK